MYILYTNPQLLSLYIITAIIVNYKKEVFLRLIYEPELIFIF